MIKSHCKHALSIAPPVPLKEFIYPPLSSQWQILSMSKDFSQKFTGDLPVANVTVPHC
jgi:hypothetical protein